MAIIKTQAARLTRVLATNSTTAGTSIANPAFTATRPTIGQSGGVIDMSLGAEMSSNALLLLPYGVGTAGNTFLMSVFAWDFVHPVIAQNAGVWVAWLLASFTCTISTVTGIAGGEVDTTAKFCDTIVLGVGNANVSNEIISPTGNVVASILLDTKGARLVEPRFALNASSTSNNALYRKI